MADRANEAAMRMAKAVYMTDGSDVADLILRDAAQAMLAAGLRTEVEAHGELLQRFIFYRGLLPRICHLSEEEYEATLEGQVTDEVIRKSAQALSELTGHA